MQVGGGNTQKKFGSIRRPCAQLGGSGKDTSVEAEEWEGANIGDQLEETLNSQP